MSHNLENLAGKEQQQTPETIGKTSTVILANLLQRVSPEKYNTIKENLSPEQIEALGEDALAHELMISDKITNIGYMLSAKQIVSITPEKLARLSEEELNEIIMNS